MRTFPPDLNFLGKKHALKNITNTSDTKTQVLISQTIFFPFLEVEDIELSKEAKALGFPIIHKHKLCCLRQELIDAFVESRYMMFIKYAAVQLQQLGLKKQMDIFQKKPEQPAIKDDKSEDSPAEGILK